MPRRWRIHPHDADRVAALVSAAKIPSVVAQLLLCRGVHAPDQVRSFLSGSLSHLREPLELPGMQQAARRIAAAISARERICVYGDYDVDGMSGTALLWLCLRLLGADAGYYVPHRLDEGYGLNHEALQSLAQQGTKLVVTVDCGIASVAEAATARRLGMELIVTDHHHFGQSLPEAAALVHPRLPGSSYPFGGLSGAGVAFKLAWALCQQASGAKKVSPRMREFLLRAVGFAALGTVADVVPLVDENRVLVQQGLLCLKQRTSPGMEALMQRTGLDKKPRLDCEDIAFSLAPRLNAAGRLCQAQLGVELLTTNSPQRAAALADYIHELNASRQSLERSIYLSANKQAQQLLDAGDCAALVLADVKWHPGVIGIVAGRLAEKYHRPVVMIALDELGARPAVGSARSVPGFNLHAALQVCDEYLISHGGHAAAAGLKIDAAQVDAFREAMCEHADGEIPREERTAELWIDAEVPLATLTMATVEQIEQLAPFGQSNPRPLFCASGVTLREPPKTIGEGGRHLALRIAQHNTQMRGVSFGNAEWAEELSALAGPLSIAFRPVINEFRGRRSVELHVADWMAEAPVPS